MSGGKCREGEESMTNRSEKLFQQAIKLIPGGVNSPVRAFKSVGGTPIFIERAEGSRIYDVDGNAYIDYVGSWGPMIVGHAHPRVIETLTRALAKGTSFGAPTELEIELAQMVIDAVPSIEMVRMVNSGTEATMSAIRVARGFTGRDKIIKFEGCYHGHADGLLVKAGSAPRPSASRPARVCPRTMRETPSPRRLMTSMPCRRSLKNKGKRSPASFSNPCRATWA